MFRITGSIVTALLMAALTLPAHADDASKRVKIDELFTLMHLQQNMEQLVTQQQAQVKQMMPTMFPDLHLAADQQKDVDAFQDKVMAISCEALDWKKLEPQFVDLYASSYDEPTVDALLTFYRSDAGKTMIAKQPDLIAKSQAITQQRMMEMLPKMREAFQQFMVDMQKKYPPAAQK